ncbi:uncharacterized protein LOC132708617 [Cylas formicarius]|uniref:uncharacterized protein LOC132695768 n=1 Tax=Cylas formicarius TaxID=197179 RepID=UPI002958934E|nr:uncharacterized protein LOC132695768 [Cylas formicarius]XP_060516552.1 uncharacterized protein LOC132696034 [Cylas formicarius]XP_060518184.1 uncharacterized protein LOC132696983 [Cylas formicarius]XP_060518571.1 uncharacterized protein LOC132697247 [Cylas formicarius]XP_060518641.1 uncharacterized protein LOC132697290 [Cylas formicarius]XP_060518660.1 uncharacterized protein LOC132697305 [Cylas formicarius]XP_060521631.1 uncharacterized protein LOC132699128 [Cylas formicarius]XP_06052202
MNTEVRCPFPYDPTTEKIAVCPYDKSHIMLAHRLGRHIFKSHKEYRGLEFPVRHETTREHHQQQEQPGGSKETKEQQEYPGGWSTEWDGEECTSYLDFLREREEEQRKEQEQWDGRLNRHKKKKKLLARPIL